MKLKELLKLVDPEIEIIICFESGEAYVFPDYREIFKYLNCKVKKINHTPDFSFEILI